MNELMNLSLKANVHKSLKLLIKYNRTIKLSQLTRLGSCVDTLGPSQQFFSHNRTFTKQRIHCLAQRHNVVSLVRLKPAAPHFQVQHSTSEPLCSSRGVGNYHIVKQECTWTRPLVKSAYRNINFLISQPNICCGYSKEPS